MVMDMLLAFSRGQVIDPAKAYTKSEFIVRRGLNGDIKKEVLKLWARIANSPAPSEAGLSVQVWTGDQTGANWEMIGETPARTNLAAGDTLAMIEVPKGLKYLVALVYKTSGTFTTPPVVDAGLVDGFDDGVNEDGDLVTVMGRYETIGRMEDIPAELAAVKALLRDGAELPPDSDVEPDDGNGGDNGGQGNGGDSGNGGGDNGSGGGDNGGGGGGQ